MALAWAVGPDRAAVMDGGWDSLPDPLTVRILQRAFEDAGATLQGWLRMSYVCRCVFKP